MSIHDFKEKIKDFVGSEKGKDFFVVGIIVLASIFSFGLGRLSISENSDRVSVEYDPSLLTASVGSLKGVSGTNGSNSVGDSMGSNITSNTSKSQGAFFASKKGTKYYPVDCGAGQTLLETNKIFFSTSAEAEKAGYSLSTACK